MSAVHDPLGALKAALRGLADWVGEGPYRGVVVGGVAASLLGRPRTTKDIDLMVLLDLDEAPDFLEVGRRLGFEPRIDDPLGFARETRMLLLTHVPSGIPIDVSLGCLPFEEDMLQRARQIDIAGVRLRVAAPEELIVMKALARRPADIKDIETVLDANPVLDLERVRRQLGDMAAALEMPEIVADFEALLQRRSRDR